MPEGFTTKNTKQYEEIRLPANKGYVGEPWPKVNIKDLDEVLNLFG